MVAQRTPPQIINAALASAPKGSLVEDRTARVLDALMDAGWGFVAPADTDAMLAAPPTHPELEALRDLAHVLEAQIEGGEINADGMALVCGALARAKPGFAYTGKDCEQAECKVHGPCDECPTEGLWQTLESKLTTWLAEHPREAVIHKTQNVGKTEFILDVRPWQPPAPTRSTGRSSRSRIPVAGCATASTRAARKAEPSMTAGGSLT